MGRPENSFLERMRSFIYSPASLGVIALSRIERLVHKGKQYILLACMPKSGSTFLASVLVELTGHKNYSLVYQFDQNEQDLYFPRVMDAYRFSSITQQHVRATGPNLQILKHYSIRPVILVRNIFDIVISIRDHLNRESTRVPMFYANKDYFDLDKETQNDFIIEMGLPWYFNFYASWFDACRQGHIDPLWMTYEELVGDKVSSISKILEFYKMNRSDGEILEAVEKVQKKGSARYNKGVAGRGQVELTKEQRGKIIGLARFYPKVNFSRIGIVR